LIPKLIAIDGPVAVGKSSVGCLLAKRLGYSFFDTGLVYRAFTWKVIKKGIPFSNEKQLSCMANETEFDFVSRHDNTFSPIIDGKDVSTEISLSEVEEKVCLVSKVADVRHRMVIEQRKLASRGKLVMAGRDIGTVVLPYAELKIFLIASMEERANRRYKELSERGNKVNYNTTLIELQRRDNADSNRVISPLKPADDAVVIETGSLTLEQVVDEIYNLAISQ
jgi:CMP/dCMP kinase